MSLNGVFITRTHSTTLLFEPQYDDNVMLRCAQQVAYARMLTLHSENVGARMCVCCSVCQYWMFRVPNTLTSSGQNNQTMQIVMESYLSLSPSFSKLYLVLCLISCVRARSLHSLEMKSITLRFCSCFLRQSAYAALQHYHQKLNSISLLAHYYNLKESLSICCPGCCCCF